MWCLVLTSSFAFFLYIYICRRQYPPKGASPSHDKYGHLYVTNVCSFTTQVCLPADCSSANPFHATGGCKPWTPSAYFGVAVQYWGNQQQCTPGDARALPAAQRCTNALTNETQCCTAACEVLGVADDFDPATAPQWGLIDANDPSAGVNVTFRGVNAAPDDPNSGHCARDTRTGMTTDRYTHMLFTCDENADEPYLYLVEENPESHCHYNFWFNTTLACLDRPDLPVTPDLPSNKLSGGSVFLIIFFVGFVGLYGVGGAVYHHRGHGEVGHPHARQWGALAGLAREGVAYAANGFSHPRTSAGSEYTSGHVGAMARTSYTNAPDPVKHEDNGGTELSNL